MKAKQIVWALALVAVGILIVSWAWRTSHRSVGDSERTDVRMSQTERIADVERPSGEKRGQIPSKKPVKQTWTVTEDEDDDDGEPKRTPEEKKLAADIETALDDEDFELAKRCVPLAMKCSDAEIRQSMVDTLAWFGEKAIPELTPFIADPDEDVAENAMNEWDCAVSSIEDDGEKIGMTEMAMGVISNEDALESISSNYIGVDEKLAVESLLRVIESGGSKPGIAKAKETYEFVTGDEFTDRAAAEKWIAEEYEPPDKD